MVVSKAQDTEDRLADLLNKATDKLTKTTEALNGAQTQALALWAKEILQHSTTNTQTRRHSLDVKRETALGQETLKVKKELKAEDKYLVRLRHKLNMVQEKEHGAQVRRNINLRHNMDNFNDALNNVKRAITGGAGFQNAIGTTVKKMAGMTRCYQELEIANKKVKETKQQLDLKTATVNGFAGMPDSADKKNAEDALKIAESAHQSAQEGVVAATKPAQGTQGMFKPLFEKLGKLGDFLGKKAVPIGIGVGVAGILMSVIVKSFSASPLFAAMMKMMKFMVTLILMPIGTFFGALLRPILILLLRKFIIPFYSTYMPQWMKLGTDIGNFIAGWSIDKLEESRNDGKLTWEDFALTINDLFFKNSGTGDGTGDGTGTGAGDGTGDTQSAPDPAKNPYSWWWEHDKWQAWELKKKDEVLGMINGELADEVGMPTEGNDLINAANAEHITTPSPDEPVTVEWDMSGESPVFNGKTPSDIEPDWEAIEKESGMYPVGQEAKDRAAAEAQLEAEAKEAREKPQKDMNNLMNEIIDTGTSMIDTVGFAARGEQTVNPNTGRLSSEAYSNAGISQTSLDERNEVRGNSDKNLGSTGSSIMDNYNAYLAGVVPAANGFDGMVNKPTMFLAGEAGVEHVSITPSGGSSGGITVNIQNMNGSDNDLRKLKKTILEVIQESSANRGRL